MIKDYGFVEPKEVKPEEYIFGASPMPFKVFKSDGKWSKPEKELQEKRFIETSNCTGFNVCAQAEVFMWDVYGIKVNYSDRFLGVMAGTRPPGNDPQRVYEAARKHGFIPDEMMPFSDDITSVDEYYSWKGADKEKCLAAGRAWLEKFEFFHEWVTTKGLTKEEKIHNQKVALKSSPLCREVYAWYKDERGVYIKIAEANHWTYQGQYTDYAKISDSYEPTEKDVEQDTNYCKRIYIAKKPNPMLFEKDLSLGMWGIDVLKLQNFLEEYGYGDFVPTGYYGRKTFDSVLKFQNENGVNLSMGGSGRFGPKTREAANRLIENSKKLYDIALSLIGADVTPEDKVSDEYACAEVVCEILNRAGYGIGYYPLTTDLYHALENDKNWIASDRPTLGAVVISPTGYGNGNIRNGHAGIVGEGDEIMSNTSADGIFRKNYTLQSWYDRYGRAGGFPILYFRRK